jgi:hypothetical protein
VNEVVLNEARKHKINRVSMEEVATIMRLQLDHRVRWTGIPAREGLSAQTQSQPFVYIPSELWFEVAFLKFLAA